jgi:hypothetical protein
VPEPWFVPHLLNVHSQCGEDGIIERLLALLDLRPGWAVEFGAADGIHLSNTRRLVSDQRWSAVMIEADPALHARLVETYEDRSDVLCLNRRVAGRAGDRDSLDAILQVTPVPADFGVLSIDVDGNDYHIWESFRLYTPHLVVIEFNPTMPSEVRFVQPNDSGLTWGSSLRSLVELGRVKGYDLAAVTAWNALFLRTEDYRRLDLGDNAIELFRRDTSDVTHIFFGQDGTALLAGAKRLPWHEVALREADVQVVPPLLREYPPRYGWWQWLLYRAWLRWTRRHSPKSPGRV